MGETYRANPMTGTGTLRVPLPSSPARGGFVPELTLEYDSGGGNGPFGLGWRLELPAITKRTDKGVPTYDDDHESDDFMLSGADVLVPVLGPDGRREVIERTVDGVPFRIHRYRPRIDELHARSERPATRSPPIRRRRLAFLPIWVPGSSTSSDRVPTGFRSRSWCRTHMPSASPAS